MPPVVLVKAPEPLSVAEIEPDCAVKTAEVSDPVVPMTAPLTSESEASVLVLAPDIESAAGNGHHAGCEGSVLVTPSTKVPAETVNGPPN